MSLKGRPAAFIARLVERFEKKWTPEPTTGCHLWSGALNADGYGLIGVGSRGHGTAIVRAAHRVGWLLEHGEVPEGLVLDHLCRNRACVNPRHLEPVTQRTNVARGDSPTVRIARALRTQEAA